MIGEAQVSSSIQALKDRPCIHSKKDCITGGSSAARQAPMFRLFHHWGIRPL